MSLADYIDATKMFNHLPKRTINIYINIKRRTKKYKLFLKQVSEEYNIPIDNLIKPGKGYRFGREEADIREAHTWVHFAIARDVAKWSKNEQVKKDLEDQINSLVK